MSAIVIMFGDVPVGFGADSRRAWADAQETAAKARVSLESARSENCSERVLQRADGSPESLWWDDAGELYRHTDERDDSFNCLDYANRER